MKNEEELDHIMNKDVENSNEKTELQTYYDNSMAAKQPSFDILKQWSLMCKKSRPD